MAPHELYFSRSIDRRWNVELERVNGWGLALFPYVTGPTALTVLQHARAGGFRLGTRFDIRDFLAGASSLSALRRLVGDGVMVREVPRLHAKVLVAGRRFASIGSQNLTAKGRKNREASVVFTEPEDVRWVSGEARKYLRAGTSITPERIEEVAALLDELQPVAEEYEEELRTRMDDFRRKRLADLARGVRKRLSTLVSGRAISKDDAEGFVRASAWWLEQRYGPTRAPGDARRIKGSPENWWIYSSNSFHISQAVRGCVRVAERVLDELEETGDVNIQQLKERMEARVARSVSNYLGEDYEGSYPVRNGYLEFGSHAISIGDFVGHFFRKSELSELEEFSERAF